MDVAAGPPSLRLDPPRLGTVLAFGLAVLLLVALAVADPAGQLLAAPAALLALGYGVRDLVRRPVLLADGQGLRVLSGWRHVAVGWAQVELLRVVRDRRTPVLELDLGSTVVALTARRLGCPPEQVLRRLDELRR